MNRSIDIGSVISRTFSIYADQASVLLPAAAVVFVVVGVISALLVVIAPVLAILAFIVILVGTTLFTGMVVELVADVQDGRRDATVGQLLNAATPVLGQLILVGILAGIGIAIGFVLIIVPGLILITIWSVAAPVVVLENPGGLKALGRSRELVKGNGWQVFGVIVVLVIGVSIVSGNHRGDRRLGRNRRRHRRAGDRRDSDRADLGASRPRCSTSSCAATRLADPPSQTRRVRSRPAGSRPRRPESEPAELTRRADP